MEKILVTGAGGMLGWHIQDLLRVRGASVFAATQDHADLTCASDVEHLFRQVRPAHVIHCAAKVYGIMGNMRNQGTSYLTNTLINTNVVDAAQRHGVKKFTAMGTGAVYPEGFGAAEGVYETDQIFNGPPHPSEAGYAHAKRGMLAMLEAYKESYGMDYAFVVSCNLFGPRDKFDPAYGHVVPALVKKFYDAAKDGGPVSVWGDGSAQRDFLYVKDAAKAVTLIHEGYNGPINMGSGSVWRIKEIVRTLSKIAEVDPSRILWDSSKPNGQAYRAYDLQPLASLGFKPQWSIAEGLRATYEWYDRSRTS